MCWAVAWQATILAVIPLVVGIALGAAAGRIARRLFAGHLGVILAVSVPIVPLALAGPAILLLANLVSIGPAMTAMRTRPASVCAASDRQARGPPWDARAMGRSRRMPARKPVISAVSLCIAAALPGCSAAAPSAGPASPAGPASSAGTVSPTAVQSAGAAAPAFTVAGDRPVLYSGSQDTAAQIPRASCDASKFAADKALGSRVARGFALTGFPASAALLRHFLAGKGTGVDYRAGSPVSKKALASGAFRAVGNDVRDAILRQLKAGRTRVKLPATQLPTVAFESRSSDLYWGFRGTQGLSVTGSGHRAHGRYAGSLTYVIRDSYGFAASDTLGGFGPPMRYLQTACGAPQHAGGARWFPDTITVTVHFQLAGRVRRC